MWGEVVAAAVRLGWRPADDRPPRASNLAREDSDPGATSCYAREADHPVAS